MRPDSIGRNDHGTGNEYAKVTRNERISSQNLVKALEARGLDVGAIKEVCREVAFCKPSTGGTGYGIGYPTIGGGYVIWNPHIGRHNFAGPAGLSFVPDEYVSNTIHLFDRLSDYIYYISREKNRPPEDILILNSNVFTSHAIDFLEINEYENILCSLMETALGKEEFFIIHAAFPSAKEVRVI